MRRPYAVILFAVNLFICWRLTKLEYSQYMGSIEAAYISISRHILASGGDLSWWPAWYAGIPFQNAYPPLLHFVVAAASALGRISVARAHHLVTAIFYCLGPVTAYWASVRLTGKRVESFVAGLVYSVVTPSALLVPIIARDMGGMWNSRRLQDLVFYGEGPHIASLALLPLALFCFDLAREKKRVEWDMLAALSLAAVVLTNWIGALGLAALMLAYLAGSRAGRPIWLRAGGISLFAYVIASPWIPPSTLAAIRFNAQTVGDYRHAYATLMWFLPVFAVALFLLRKAPVWVIFAFLMAVPTLGSHWFGIDVVPQPQRYHLEMDLGLTFAVVLAVASFVPAKARTAVFCVLILICGYRAWRTQRYARGLVQPIEITKTIEYRSAKWFEANMPAERVFTAGSVEFWLNAFSDGPQFGGGFLQGLINYEVRVGSYFLTALDDPTDTVLWLKAYGVRAVETNGPASSEVFKDFVYPRKFEGVLEQVWRSGDDAIYRVPGESLAHVMRPGDLVKRPPVNGLDVEEIRRFVAALDKPGRFTWNGTHAASVDAHLEQGQIVSVQENYHPGWHVSRGRLFKDGLGLMAIDPECAGDCHFELFYDGGAEMRTAIWASRTALVGGLVWIWISRRRRSSAPLETPAR